MTELVELRGASSPTVNEDLPGTVNRLHNTAYRCYSNALRSATYSKFTEPLVYRDIDTSANVPVLFVSHHGPRAEKPLASAPQPKDLANEQALQELRTLRNAWVHGNPTVHVRQALLDNFHTVRSHFDEWTEWFAARSESMNEPIRLLISELDSGMRIRVLQDVEEQLRIPEAEIKKHSELVATCIAHTQEWTEEQNQRRCELVDKEIDGTLTDEDAVELEHLQSTMLAYRRRLAPLPLKEVRELHQALLEKAQKQNGEE